MPKKADPVAQAFVSFLRARHEAGEIPNRAELAKACNKSRAWATMVLDYGQGAIDVDTAFCIAAWFNTTVEAIAEGAAPQRITRAYERPFFESLTKIPEESRPQALSVLRTFEKRARPGDTSAPAAQSGKQTAPKAPSARGKRRGA